MRDWNEIGIFDVVNTNDASNIVWFKSLTVLFCQLLKNIKTGAGAV